MEFVQRLVGVVRGHVGGAWDHVTAEQVEAVALQYELGVLVAEREPSEGGTAACEGVRG